VRTGNDDEPFYLGANSGATLIRPGLERLRDLAAVGTLDQLYIHSPDRLARHYAYQVLLLEEFQRAGVTVIFVNRELGQSPDDDLLLQVQGMVAEYERAKILERSRRGKRHAARMGVVSVLGGAPFGYRYVTKAEGGGQARYDICLEEAGIVRQIFRWVGIERLSIGEVQRRLTQAQEPTRTGKTTWDRSAIWGILKNPAYKGMAAFGKTREVEPPPRLRAQRGHLLPAKKGTATRDRPPEEWLSIPVPALVDDDLFAIVQEQLEENRRHARQGQRGARYLLQGVVTCAQCGYAYYGKALSPSARKHHERSYAYYRCLGTDAYRFGGERVCQNRQVRTDLLELLVWQEVCDVLKEPQRVQEEYQRRLQPTASAQAADAVLLERQRGKLRQEMARLIDSYTEGVIEKSEFEPRIARLRQRVDKLDEEVQRLQDEAHLQADLRLLVGRLEEFADQVKDGLAEADWQRRRTIIRALVKRVEIGQDAVTVVFRVTPDPFAPTPEEGVLLHCGRSRVTVARQYRLTWDGTGRLTETNRTRNRSAHPLCR
jgi:site-specific DNA recombinase